MRSVIAAFLSVIVIAAAEADAQVSFKAPMEFAGTGCGSSSYSFTGEGTDTLSVLFSAYDAANPASLASSGLERAGCSFAVPVQVPAGYQVSVMTADWRGYAEGSTELFREYFLAGKKGVSNTSNPSGNYIEHDDALTFSSCGEDVVLRINSSVRAIDSGSYIVIDSVDLQNAVVFHLQWKKCNSLPPILELLL